MRQGLGFTICGGKGFHLTFANRWTVSVQFGPGNYCDNYDLNIRTDDVKAGKDGSTTAEVACWSDNGELAYLGSDSVAGHQTPDQVARLIAVVSGLAETDRELPADYLFERQRSAAVPHYSEVGEAETLPSPAHTVGDSLGGPMTDHLPDAVRQAIQHYRSVVSDYIITVAAGICDDARLKREEQAFDAAILAYGEQRYREGVEAATTCISCGKSGVHLKCEGFC